MRLDRALRWAMGAAVGSCAFCALTILALRWSGYQTLPITLLSLIPCIAAFAGGALAFALTQVSRADAAAVLDHRAATHEHVVTWLHLQNQNESDDTRAAFKQAQRNATLKQADSI